jgi:16S rRNA (adenine1518-N6/adenine1519-N6)-dimethyltransferase
LTCLSTAKKIVSQVKADSASEVIEIGPGLGALTFLLLKEHSVVAIERDYVLANTLANQFLTTGAYRLHVLTQDVLTVKLSETPFSRKKKIVVGNLPYKISSQIIFWLIENRKWVAEAVLMMQSEMADRLCAQNKTKDYAPITILTNLVFRIKKCFRVSPNVFYPRPKVWSTVISLESRDLTGMNEDEFFLFGDFLRSCFHSRRKTLVNNLKVLDIGAEQLEEILLTAGITKSIRAEELTDSQFMELFHRVKLLGALTLNRREHILYESVNRALSD